MRPATAGLEPRDRGQRGRAKGSRPGGGRERGLRRQGACCPDSPPGPPRAIALGTAARPQHCRRRRPIAREIDPNGSGGTATPEIGHRPSRPGPRREPERSTLSVECQSGFHSWCGPPLGARDHPAGRPEVPAGPWEPRQLSAEPRPAPRRRPQGRDPPALRPHRNQAAASDGAGRERPPRPPLPRRTQARPIRARDGDTRRGSGAPRSARTDGENQGRYPCGEPSGTAPSATLNHAPEPITTQGMVTICSSAPGAPGV